MENLFSNNCDWNFENVIRIGLVFRICTSLGLNLTIHAKRWYWPFLKIELFKSIIFNRIYIQIFHNFFHIKQTSCRLYSLYLTYSNLRMSPTNRINRIKNWEPLHLFRMVQISCVIFKAKNWVFLNNWLKMILWISSMTNQVNWLKMIKAWTSSRNKRK